MSDESTKPYTPFDDDSSSMPAVDHSELVPIAVDPDAYCREHGTPRVTCDESHPAPDSVVALHAYDIPMTDEPHLLTADQIRLGEQMHKAAVAALASTTDPALRAESRTRRISLTGRAPVEIVEDEWPVVATAAWHDSNRPPEMYGDRAGRKCLLYVRKHADGRVLVYGVFEPGKSDHAGQGAIRAGYLLAMATSRNVPDCIGAVGRLIGASSHLVQACLDALPAEQL